MRQPLAFTVNTMELQLEVQPGMRLLDLLRDELHLTGTKEGCGEGECGACTVLVDGLPVNACLYPALELEGKQVTTIEGLTGPDNTLSPVQQAFVDHGGIQCGFCSPGMIISSTALLNHDPDPTEIEIREALVGNLCRCTGYAQIVESVRHVARSGGAPLGCGGATLERGVEHARGRTRPGKEG